MDEKKTVLIVEDEKSIVDILQYNLKKEYNILTANDGEAGLDMALKENPDILLLDLMLPKLDGFEVCRILREKGNKAPVIILTAREGEDDKVKGLELGADDYIMKPFDSKELVARVKAVLRRYQTAPKAEEPKTDKGKCVEYPGITINLTNYTVLVDGQRVEMPPKELELLYFLASSPNQVFTREQLLDQIWGYEYIGDTRTVDVHIKRLREKIKDHSPWGLATVWGIGYKFEVK